MLVILSFVFTGGSLVLANALAQFGLADWLGYYLLGFYLAGVIIAAGVAVVMRRRTSLGRWDAAFGVLFAAASLGGISFMLLALRSQVPAGVVFPFRSCGGILLTSAFSRAVLGERLTGVQLAGLGLALVAIVLLTAP